jgi:hypothetical protein
VQQAGHAAKAAAGDAPAGVALGLISSSCASCSTPLPAMPVRSKMASSSASARAAGPRASSFSRGWAGQVFQRHGVGQWGHTRFSTMAAVYRELLNDR